MNSKWTERDYNSMTWHDCYVYAMSFINDDEEFENKLIFDLDYILEWKVLGNNSYYEFSIAPCNLIFFDVHNLEINIKTGLVTGLNLEIDNLALLGAVERENGYTTNRWHIELQNGDILFEAKGYRQIARKEPQITSCQKLSLVKRGGVFIPSELS